MLNLLLSQFPSNCKGMWPLVVCWLTLVCGKVYTHAETSQTSPTLYSPLNSTGKELTRLQEGNLSMEITAGGISLLSWRNELERFGVGCLKTNQPENKFSPNGRLSRPHTVV